MGAPSRRCAGHDPALPAGPLAQCCPRRGHRPRRGLAPDSPVSEAPIPRTMTNLDPVAFPPDPERCARTERWFTALRDRIAACFEAIEDEFASGRADGLAPGRFERRE